MSALKTLLISLATFNPLAEGDIRAAVSQIERPKVSALASNLELIHKVVSSDPQSTEIDLLLNKLFETKINSSNTQVKITNDGKMLTYDVTGDEGLGKVQIFVEFKSTQGSSVDTDQINKVWLRFEKKPETVTMKSPSREAPLWPNFKKLLQEQLSKIIP